MTVLPTDYHRLNREGLEDVMEAPEEKRFRIIVDGPIVEVYHPISTVPISLTLIETNRALRGETVLMVHDNGVEFNVSDEGISAGIEYGFDRYVVDTDTLMEHIF